VNVGENRWTFKPQLVVGQRFLKIITLEASFNTTIHGNNPDLVVSQVGKVALKQHATYALDPHLGVDLAPTMFVGLSYYMEKDGRRRPINLVGEVVWVLEALPFSGLPANCAADSDASAPCVSQRSACPRSP